MYDGFCHGSMANVHLVTSSFVPCYSFPKKMQEKGDDDDDMQHLPIIRCGAGFAASHCVIIAVTKQRLSLSLPMHVLDRFVRMHVCVLIALHCHLCRRHRRHHHSAVYTRRHCNPTRPQYINIKFALAAFTKHFLLIVSSHPPAFLILSFALSSTSPPPPTHSPCTPLPSPSPPPQPSCSSPPRHSHPLHPSDPLALDRQNHYTSHSHSTILDNTTRV